MRRVLGCSSNHREIFRPLGVLRRVPGPEVCVGLEGSYPYLSSPRGREFGNVVRGHIDDPQVIGYGQLSVQFVKRNDFGAGNSRLKLIRRSQTM